MPTAHEMRESANKLEERFNLPNLLLGVDGTHIRLDLKPSDSDLPEGLQAQDFWCRYIIFQLNTVILFLI